ncbi:MAG: hypothetical protein JNL90_11720 [Planctomycetes bacterium]|nr:hypothetical protein [Planctomycetota bacterium]
MASESRPRAHGGSAPRCAAAWLCAAALAAPLSARAQETPATAPSGAPATAPAPQAAPPRAPRPAELGATHLEVLSSTDADQAILLAENLWLRLDDGAVELRADWAILWGDRDLLLLRKVERSQDAPSAPFRPEVPPAPGRAPLPLAGGASDASAALVQGLHEVYAEGHVYFRQGAEQVLFAESLYQHLLEQRGVLVEADAFGRSAYKGTPIDVHVRAAALRTLGPRLLVAEEAQFSTCAYGHPHYHVRSDALSITLRDPLARAAGAAPAGSAASPGPGIESLALRDNVLRLDDTTLFPLPSFTARLDAGDGLPLKKVRAGHSKRFGAYLQTLWGADLPDEAAALQESLALDPARPLELGWELDVDGYARRGGGLGPALQWKVPGAIDGELGGYWIHDRRGEDFGQPFDFEHADRGRAYLRDRFTPIEHWRLDTEVQWLSDAGFQPEYFEREFKEEKEPESYAHLVRQEEQTRWRFLYRNRLNDFTTQVDQLPRAGFDRVGEPLLRLPLPRFLENDGKPAWVVLTQAHDVAHQRLRTADGSLLDDERVARADSLLDLSTTLSLGPLSLRPFTAGRFTGWDRRADDGSSIGRAAGLAGARSELMVHRNYDAWAPSFGIDGLRHIVLFDADYVNLYDVSRDPDELVQIDDVDALDQREVYLLAIRQRAQTHRGQSIEDVAELDLELPLYPHAQRDNVGPIAGSTAGRTAGPLRYDAVVRPGLRDPIFRHAYAWSEGEWNFHDGAFDTVNVGAALQPTLEWTTLLSWRVTRGYSRVITGELDWRLTDKWSVALLEQYDLEQRNGLEHRYELRRHGHDFTLTFGFERDRGDGDLAFTFALYPSFLMRGRAERSLSSGRGDRPQLGEGY